MRHSTITLDRLCPLPGARLPSLAHPCANALTPTTATRAIAALDTTRALCIILARSTAPSLSLGRQSQEGRTFAEHTA